MKQFLYRLMLHRVEKEWPTIIHSYIHLGVILQDGTKGSLARRIAGFFRMKRLKE